MILDFSRGYNDWWLADVGQGANGTGQYIDASNGYTITAADIGRLWLQGDPSASSSQTLQVRAYDGKAWSDWDSFGLTTNGPNARPKVTVEDVSLSKGGYKKVTDFVTYTDSDGDSATRYNLWTSNDWWLADVGQDASGTGKSLDANAGYTVTAAEFGRLYVRADDKLSDQVLWVQAYDGEDYSDWASFTLKTDEDTKPMFPSPIVFLYNSKR